MINLIKQNKKVYNIIAPHFSSTRQYLWDGLRPLAKYTKDGDKVLDIGCGNGRLYQLFEKKQVQYFGIDQSEELIKIAKKKVPQGKFIVGEMTSLPFKDEEFDVIYCVAAFHHLPTVESRLKALKEMKRVAGNNAYILMANWNLRSDSVQKKLAKFWRMKNKENDFIVPWKSDKGEVLGERYYHAFSAEEMQNLIKKSGLELIEQYYVKRNEKIDARCGNNLISIIKSTIAIRAICAGRQQKKPS